LPPGRGITASAGSTEARNDILSCFGRSDRRAQIAMVGHPQESH
jgi:hypothetical protein